MTTAATDTKPEVRNLKSLDRPRIKADAATWAAEKLDGARPEDVVRLARAEEAAAERATAKRDAAIWTLLNHYHLRRGANLAGAVGVGRSGLQKIKDRLAKSNPDPVPDADEALPKLAAAAMRHIERVNALRDPRDEAVNALLDSGVAINDVADMLGRDRSRVSHIKHRGTSEGE